MGKIDKIILLDADVIIHFYKGDQILLLTKLYPGRLHILDAVIKELSGVPASRDMINNFLKFGIAKRIDFPIDPQIRREYATLIRKFGPGESACLAYVRFKNDILASSNLRDIRAYCEQYEIEYLTTMDFLSEAFYQGFLREADCDEFIDKVILKGSKLPCRTIKEYIERKKDDGGDK